MDGGLKWVVAPATSFICCQAARSQHKAHPCVVIGALDSIGLGVSFCQAFSRLDRSLGVINGMEFVAS